MSSKILCADAMDGLCSLDSGSARCIVTSPPYFGLRDYGVTGQIGLEATPDEFVSKLVAVFREARRVLSDDGTLWLNLGDSYATSFLTRGDIASNQIGLRPKDLVGIPWRVAFALQADGWCLRQDIIWHKPNPMPESVRDRCTKSHEYLFLLSKNERYYFDNVAIKERAKSDAPAGNKKHKYVDAYQNKGNEDHRTKGGLLALSDVVWETRNRRSVWTVASRPFKDAHFATFPPALIEPCILAGSAVGDVVLDPFSGSGTTCLVANRLNRFGIGIELNPTYVELSQQRLAQEADAHV